MGLSTVVCLSSGCSTYPLPLTYVCQVYTLALLFTHHALLCAVLTLLWLLLHLQQLGVLQGCMITASYSSVLQYQLVLALVAVASHAYAPFCHFSTVHCRELQAGTS